MRFHFFLFFGLILLWCSAEIPASAATGKAIQAFNFDFDDNLFTTSARIMVKDAKGREWGIPTAAWPLLRMSFGPQGNSPWKAFTLDPATSMRFFGDTTPEGDDLFKRQIENALKDPDPASWKGPSWDAFVNALSQPESRAYTTIITARNHKRGSILKGLQVLKNRGLIPSLPPLENIFSVGAPDLDPRFLAPEIPMRKALVMEYLLDRLESQPTSVAALHLWEFSDDDYSNYQAAHDVLSAQAERNRWPHVKIRLSYTGLNNSAHAPNVEMLPTIAR